MAGGHVADVHQVEAGVHVGRHPPGQEVGDDPARSGVGAWSPGPTGAVGLTTTTCWPAAAASSARRSDATFERLYAPITCAGRQGRVLVAGARRPPAGRPWRRTRCAPSARPRRAAARRTLRGALDVGAVDLAGAGAGERVARRHVEDGVGAPRGRGARRAASSRSPGAGSQPAGSRPEPMLSGRTRARTVQPRASRSAATWPPMNPVAPVTRATLTASALQRARSIPCRSAWPAVARRRPEAQQRRAPRAGGARSAAGPRRG